MKSSLSPAAQSQTIIVKKAVPDGKMEASRVNESVRIVNQLGYVIFPDSKWIKIWDSIMIFFLLCIAFIIPYQIGVSGGVYLITNLWWLIVTVLMNTFFFFDTFLYFWRAYRDKEGRLVFDLRRIRRRYLKTYFIPNLLSNFPATLIFYFTVKYRIRTSDPESTTFVFIKMMDLLKLLRVFRVKTVLKTSVVITQVRQSFSSQLLELYKYISLLVLVSHVFACTWSFVAYFEAGQFNEAALLNNPNWIGSWYESNNSEGGLNPLGWFQDIDRYILSLFWAIQSITSIGYGNIIPVTPAEWWVACVIMLLAGIMWAYTIGGLVGVVAAMNARNEIYRERIDQANAMIKEFGTSHTLHEGDCPDKLAAEIAMDAERRIKTYIYNQYMMSNNSSCATDVKQSFPVMETLSPQLQMLSAFMVLKDDLETVPYLSSRFLSIAARSEVAMECVFLEFAAGDIIDLEKGVGDLGRGIFVILKGMGILREHSLDMTELGHILLPMMTCGERKVLVEDGHPAVKGSLHLLGFTKVVFIPRRAVLAALATNPSAWKECARWKYFTAVLLSAENMKKDLCHKMGISSRDSH